MVLELYVRLVQAMCVGAVSIVRTSSGEADKLLVMVGVHQCTEEKASLEEDLDR